MNKKKFWGLLLLLSWINYYLLYCAIKYELNANLYSDMDNMASILFIPIIYIGVAIIKIGMNVFSFIDVIYFPLHTKINLNLFLINKKDFLLWKIISILFYMGIILFMIACCKSWMQNNIIGSVYFISNQLLLFLYLVWFRNSQFFNKIN